MTLSFENYTHGTTITAIYPDPHTDFTYPALGLSGEAGEVCEKIKKHIRKNGNAPLTEALKADLVLELGDVLYYLARLALVCGVTLQEVAEQNQHKLLSRKDRDVLHGDGDNR